MNFNSLAIINSVKTKIIAKLYMRSNIERLILVASWNDLHRKSKFLYGKSWTRKDMRSIDKVGITNKCTNFDPLLVSMLSLRL